MFKQELKEKYPDLINYFESALTSKEKALSHSIILYGRDTKSQYSIATEIARILNCKETKDENCSCLNCNWIREKSHPAVLTISKIENKTMITVEQAHFVIQSLLTTSDYHRVFIFCDAEIIDNEWTPLPLNQKNIHIAAINALLKTVEEPPSNTTFFFLTKNKNDIIDTIVSRSQSFFVPNFEKTTSNYNLVEDIIKNYPNIERNKTFDIAKKIANLLNDYTPNEVLSQVQNYMSAVLKSNLNNPQLKVKIISDIKEVEQTKKNIQGHLNPLLAIENMFLNITKIN